MGKGPGGMHDMVSQTPSSWRVKKVATPDKNSVNIQDNNIDHTAYMTPMTPVNKVAARRSHQKGKTLMMMPIVPHALNTAMQRCGVERGTMGCS